jgi:hypothetical protein
VFIFIATIKLRYGIMNLPTRGEGISLTRSGEQNHFAHFSYLILPPKFLFTHLSVCPRTEICIVSSGKGDIVLYQLKRSDTTPLAPAYTLPQAHGRLGTTFCLIEPYHKPNELIFSSVGRDGRWNRYKVLSKKEEGEGEDMTWSVEKIYSSKFTEGSLDKVGHSLTLEISMLILRCDRLFMLKVKCISVDSCPRQASSLIL